MTLKKLLIVPILITVFSSTGFGQENYEIPDHTLSPFFYIQTDNPELDQLPLKGISSTVRIVGVIADVIVEQLYTNEGEQPLEAIYVFPASTRASVYGMEMIIGDRTITAEIRDREEARQEYEEARDEGRSASLLEQQRPNVFQMSVANIMPGDSIRVSLKYTETVVPTEGIYEFVYPTVVGPRYSEKPLSEADPHDLFVASPYTHEGEPPTYTFTIDVELAAGLPIQEIYCNTHTVNIEQHSPDNVTVRLNESEKYGGNRDYILRYSLSDEQIDPGLLLYESEDENFFLFMGQPPARVLEEDIPPREYIFIMDVSGSMRGFPINVSKTLLKDLIYSLRPTDSFNVILFAGGSTVLSDESVAATSENVEWALDVIDNQQGGGGTRLLPALQRALELPRKSENTARTIVLVTDGYVDVEKETFNLIRNNLHEANLFSFGIGSSVNRFLIESTARAGMGESFVVTDETEAPVIAERFRQYIRTPVLTRVEFTTGNFETYDVEPVSIPDVLAERPVIIFGKWRGARQGILTLSGFTGEGHYDTQIDVGDIEPANSNAVLRYLWARHRIAMLEDYAAVAPGDDLIAEITELGLSYSLLTAYTSFVAVDRIVRNDGTELSRVEQPLPLPMGVEDTAVGGVSGSMAVDEAQVMTWFGKIFYRNDGVWIDSEYSSDMIIEEYEDGIHVPEQINRFVSLSQEMIVVESGKAYRLRASLPDGMLKLLQNTPNPFNSETTIDFQLSTGGAATPVSLVIYDISGQQVRVYTWDSLTPGKHTVRWDGHDQSSL